MRSFSEIEATTKKASKAIGFSWGISEEVGKNIRLLEMFGLPGLKNLNQYYKIYKISNFENSLNNENHKGHCLEKFRIQKTFPSAIRPYTNFHAQDNCQNACFRFRLVSSYLFRHHL